MHGRWVAYSDPSSFYSYTVNSYCNVVESELWLECTVGQSQGNTPDGHYNYTMYMQQPTCNWHIQYKLPVII